ncbi:MAG: nucleoside diphosphate kinase regulator [Proteobacteria bacterium]|nr:nucleoside diphosphate kinase regulator [Pseudomonadota bacterium]
MFRPLKGTFHEKSTIFITEADLEKLEEYLATAMKKGGRDQGDLADLEAELAKCQIVGSSEIPPNVVTLNSRVRFRDLTAGEEMTVTLVFPGRANLSEGRLSVISPIGTALLGYAEGDVIEWKVRGETKTFRIEEVLYQPEAAGNFDL